MKIITEHKGKYQLGHIQYNHTDLGEFKTRFGIPEKVANDLCEYLKESKNIVDVRETYDPQCEWCGFDFKIGNVDLSGNGFCFKKDNVRQFLESNTEEDH